MSPNDGPGPAGPPDPCAAGCLFGFGPDCHARRVGVPRLCVLAHTLGRDDYADMIRRESGVPAAPASQAAPPTIAVTPATSPIPLAGDIVAAMTRRIGADRFASWVAAKLGADCGCAERQRKLNELDAKLRRWLRLGDP